MAKDYRKKIYYTLLAATLMVLILGQNHAGFVLYIVVLALLPWIAYSGYVMIKKPEIRASQLARVSIWIVAIALVASLHYIRHMTTRHNADEIAAAITGFFTTHGRYPSTLDEIGITHRELKEKLGMSGYVCHNGEPHLFYAATYIIFDTYHYDFVSGSWVYSD